MSIVYRGSKNPKDDGHLIKWKNKVIANYSQTRLDGLFSGWLWSEINFMQFTYRVNEKLVVPL